MAMVDHKTDTLSGGGGGNRVDLTEVKQCAGWAATGAAVMFGTGLGAPLAGGVAATTFAGCLFIESLD